MADTEVQVSDLPRGAPRAGGAGLRVLFVTAMWPSEERPWYGTYIRTQAESLEDLGVEVDVFLISGWETRRAYATGAARMLAANLHRRYDVVHAHYGHAGAVARFQMRAPVVVSYCGSDLMGVYREDGSITRRSRLEVAAFRQVGAMSRATITKTEEMARILPRRAQRHNHVIPNGVSLERFRPVDRDAARDRLGWPRDEHVALFVGDPQIPVKGYALAEETCRLAAREVPSLRLRVAWGHDPDDVPLCMAAADALLFTSQAEGSPNAVKEAMAVELPVVATAVGDVPERLAGLPGCHYGPPDPEELAAALVRAVGHGRVPEARVAVTSLSLQAVGRRVLDVYETVV